jgi:DNA-directed RNA polymerase specialized sigma24 family protein
MGTRMDADLRQAHLSTLTHHCSNELMRHRRRELADDSYCLEIFRRAIIQHDDRAWSMVQNCFGEIVRIWVRSHSSRDIALLRDTEENYVAQTFSRFWYAVHNQSLEFATLNSALSYLHATLNGIIMDTMRVHLGSREVPLPEPGLFQEPVAEENDDHQTLWESLGSLLSDERERRVTYLLYYCGLKPREIASRFPLEFADVKEVYRLNQNVIDRLRRNRDRLRWLLGGEEI